jgi:antitoxin ParD1/3/4
MSRTITLNPAQQALLQRLLESGRFPDEQAAISAGLLRLDDELADPDGWSVEALRRAVQEGIDSGPGKPADEVFDRLETKYAELERRRSSG